MRDSFVNHLPESIFNQNFKQGLSQHKFDFNSQKYTDFVQMIVSEKRFKESGIWDVSKISNDFKNKQNINNIWRLCKFYLMLEGFKEIFDSLNKNIEIKQSFNNLSNSQNI